MFYRKWKIKNVVVLDVQSAAHLDAFLIKQGMFFVARLLMFQACAEASACDHLPHMPKPGFSKRFYGFLYDNMKHITKF